MKNDMLGLIFASNPEASMGELTSKRSLAAVPVGGRYRIIDFMLSNMVNSHIVKVGITTPPNYRSLTDHLGTGKDWDLDRKENGLYILPPQDFGEGTAETMGGVDVIRGVTHFLEKSRQEYVLVTDCNIICNMNFEDALAKHIEEAADITLFYYKNAAVPKNDLKRNIFMQVDEDGIVTDLQVYPIKQTSDNVYMHAFIMSREMLLDLISDAAAHGKHSLPKEVFLPNLNSLKVCAYEFTGYRKKIESIQSYFSFNLELLDKDVRNELFGLENDRPVYTKIKDMVPTKYGKDNTVVNSFIADGCVIEGDVKNSILFRGVRVGKGAKIENCILMQNSQVMENCLLENVVFDKNVVLRSGRKLVGQDTYPMVISKNKVV